MVPSAICAVTFAVVTMLQVTSGQASAQPNASAKQPIRIRSNDAVEPPPTYYDIIVYGSTPGGIMSAIGAANYTSAGSRFSVLLVSTTQNIGGMASSGLGHTDIGNASVVGGAAMQFFQRVGLKYGMSQPCYDFEPHVAEDVFEEMLAEFPNIDVLRQQTLVNVAKVASEIKAITFTPTQFAISGNAMPRQNTTTYSGKMFVDATYEGDLLAMANVTFALGRESPTVYNESLAGRLQVPNMFGKHQFEVPLNYTDAAGQILPMIYTGDPGSPGDGDDKIQAYNFRMCLTDNPSNRVALTKPDNYDPSYWELFRRYLRAQPPVHLSDLMIISRLPNNKTDINNNGPISTDFIGASWTYPTATAAQRQIIFQQHVDYTAGFFFFIATDPSVPVSVREEMSLWGLCADEFVDTGNWPFQLYVREGRRMLGPFVFTQADREFNLTKSDSIGLFSYNIDAHNAQRFPQGNYVRNEGDVEMFGNLGPGQIPYRAILPSSNDCSNLAVPVALSASHIGFGALRLEPQWMIIGQSTGHAVGMAVEGSIAIQDVNITKLQNGLRAFGQLIDL